MAEQNFPDNTIYELDNLDVLRGMNSETVNLIATDPPFNTKRNRASTAGFYVDNWKWGDTGKLPDQWAWNEVHPVWLEEIRDENRALYGVIEAAGHCHGQDIAAFLCFLSVRLLEMHRVLKPTGSIYLHCDHTANAYIRMAMDAIFGARNFRNEIVWKRATAHSDAGRYGNISDAIMFYGKTRETTWNGEKIATPKTQEQLDAAYPSRDSVGKFQSSNLTGPLHGAQRGTPSTQPWRRYDVHTLGRCWSVPRTGKYAQYIEERFIPEYSQIEGIQARLDALDQAGLIIHPKRGAWPGLKRYADADQGNQPQNIILEPTGFTNFNKGPEYTGSPDQKPLALYEKFVLASSNPGDLVLDPFAGCATTLMAAQKNGRRWVGIDRRQDARFHVVCRMEGIKAKDVEDIRKLPHLTNWLDARLAQHDAHFRTIPPARTDEGDTAVPYLAPFCLPRERPALNHKQMKDFLLETFGLRCWGCNFLAPDERHLQLDHADPKRDGGSNDLDNRTLLCQPCNIAKSSRITLGQLRRENIRDGHLTRHPGTRRGDDGHPIRLPEARQQCRAALERHRAGQPLQPGMAL